MASAASFGSASSADADAEGGTLSSTSTDVVLTKESLEALDEMDARFQDVLTKALKDAEVHDAEKHQQAMFRLTATLTSKPIEFMVQKFFDQVHGSEDVHPTVTVALDDAWVTHKDSNIWSMEFKVLVTNGLAKPKSAEPGLSTVPEAEAEAEAESGDTKALAAPEHGTGCPCFPCKEMKEGESEVFDGRIHRRDSPFWGIPPSEIHVVE